MLSISNITSKHATNYHSNSDYYTKDNTKIIGEWYGKIAERLNLNNKPFEKTDFENILNLNGRAKKIENGKLRIENYKELKTDSLNKEISNNLSTEGVENESLSKQRNEETVITNLNISENNKVKTTNDLNIKVIVIL